jgi:hypothetical protein
MPGALGGGVARYSAGELAGALQGDDFIDSVGASENELTKPSPSD